MIQGWRGEALNGRGEEEGEEEEKEMWEVLMEGRNKQHLNNANRQMVGHSSIHPQQTGARVGELKGKTGKRGEGDTRALRGHKSQVHQPVC